MLTDEFLNIAHRGGGRLAPEETLVAYQNAVDVGADVLEMDARATMDGVIILCHDNTVDRTSDGGGVISNKTFDELRQLDAGYQFTRDGGATYPFRGQGITFPTLLEVLEAHPTMLFAIEIKEAETAADVVAVIEQAGVEDRVIVASFSDAAVLQVRAINPDVLTAQTVSESLDFARLTDDDEVDYRAPAWVIQAPPDLGELIVDEAFTQRAARLDVKVHVWTINDPGEMQDFLDIAIDGIMTDDPETLESLTQ